MSANEFFITIPERLLDDERLSHFQRILYGKLVFRANDKGKGYCDDTNLFLADIMKIKQKTELSRKNHISRSISNLAKCGYVNVVCEKESRNMDKRKIYILGDTRQAPRIETTATMEIHETADDEHQKQYCTNWCGGTKCKKCVYLPM